MSMFIDKFVSNASEIPRFLDANATSKRESFIKSGNENCGIICGDDFVSSMLNTIVNSVKRLGGGN